MANWSVQSYDLLNNKSFSSKESTFNQFKFLTKDWQTLSDLQQIEITKQLNAIGWIRRGVAWIHKDDLKNIIHH